MGNLNIENKKITLNKNRIEKTVYIDEILGGIEILDLVISDNKTDKVLYSEKIIVNKNFK